MDYEKHERRIRIFGGVVATISLALLIAIVCVAWHFIAKYW